MVDSYCAGLLRSLAVILDLLPHYSCHYGIQSINHSLAICLPANTDCNSVILCNEVCSPFCPCLLWLFELFIATWTWLENVSGTLPALYQWVSLALPLLPRQWTMPKFCYMEPINGNNRQHQWSNDNDSGHCLDVPPLSHGWWRCLPTATHPTINSNDNVHLQPAETRCRRPHPPAQPMVHRAQLWTCH